MKTHTNEQIAIRVSMVTIIGNVILSVFKLTAGLLGHSSAMISDSVHSFSDVLSSFVVIAGIKMSNRKSDESHPYGHERLECVAALILSMMLAVTGVGIGISGINTLLNIENDPVQTPSTLALAAAIISIVSKEGMYWYTRLAAKKVNSGALLADAWHHRSDALSSIGSFIGILGAQLGFAFFDPLACIVICIFILKVAIDIFLDSIQKMVDHSCDKKTVEKIKNIILINNDVKAIDDLKTRLFGDKIYIDVEISVNKNCSVIEGHYIAQKVHDSIEETLPNVKHCMVHVNPYFTED